MKKQKRGEASTPYSTKVFKDANGESYIDIPNELMEDLNWKIGDTIEWKETEMLGEIFDDVGLLLRNLTQEKDARFSGREYETEEE